VLPSPAMLRKREGQRRVIGSNDGKARVFRDHTRNGDAREDGAHRVLDGVDDRGIGQVEANEEGRSPAREGIDASVSEIGPEQIAVRARLRGPPPRRRSR
jgi:hypothetical protein